MRYGRTGAAGAGDAGGAGETDDAAGDAGTTFTSGLDEGDGVVITVAPYELQPAGSMTRMVKRPAAGGFTMRASTVGSAGSTGMPQARDLAK